MDVIRCLGGGVFLAQKPPWGLLIKQINDDLEKRANNSLRPQSLTIAQVGALLALEQAPERQMSLKELERALHVAQSTTVGILQRLEQKGFVEAVSDPSDRRIKILRITKRGLDCCALAVENMAHEEDRLLSGLTGEEREVFTYLLQKVRNTLN